MSFDPSNFKFSPDFNEMSWGDFKALMKKRYDDLLVKEIKVLYKTLNGDPSSVSKTSE